MLIFFLFSKDKLQAQQYQENTKFKHLSSADGLSDNSVSAIMQDKEGFIWLGTSDGLNKYNGYDFTIYRHNPVDSTSIGSGRINCIFEDKEGLIWIGAEGSLSVFNKQKNEFKVYKNDTENSFSLGHNLVTDIIEDKEGNMWISTYGGGLNKFDKESSRFKVYKNIPENSNSISSDFVENCFEDSKGIIWVSTFGGAKGGLNSFDKISGKFTYHSTHFSNKKLENSQLLRFIKEDKSGLIYIANGTHFHGITVFDKSANTVVKQYLNDPLDKGTLSNNFAQCFYDDENGHVWVGTQNGLNILDKSTGRFTVFKYERNNPDGLSDNFITSIYKDNQGLIWIGTGQGVNIYNKDNNSFIVFKTNLKNEKSLNSNQVNSVFEDAEGEIWMGTGANGLTNYDRSSGEFKCYKERITADNKKESIGRVSSIQEINGKLWLGVFSSSVFEFDKSNNKFRPLSAVSGEMENTEIPVFIFGLLADSKKTLWTATPGGLFNINFLEGKKEIYKNDPANPNSISENFTCSVFEDSDKNVWVCTRSAGLNVFERSTGKFFCFKNDPSNPNSINNDVVNIIYQTPDGVMWVGTNGGGLNALILKKGTNKFIEGYKFFHFTDKDGLPNNIIAGILPDGKGNLWVSTNLGISKFTPPSYLTSSNLTANGEPQTVNGNSKPLFKNYDINDGLPNNSVTGAAFKTKNGLMYFGSADGLVCFHPDSIKDNLHRAPVYITSFKIFEKDFPLDTPISAKREMVLSYKQSFFSFEFVALDYAEPSKNQYAYMMEGFDSTWIYVSNRRYASYTNLDPGEYVFRVKASNNNGLWNDKGASIRIIITPPFWRTNLFYTICIMLIITLVYGYIKWRERKLMEEKKILEEQVVKRTKEVVEEKNKVESANSEIIEKNKSLGVAYHIIEEKNLQITDSINYALYIQKAILPTVSKIDGMLTDYFILFKPKDIVSGDFFWFDNKLTTPRANQPAQEVIAIAAVDCTGHGVPGALMSVIGSTILNQTINRSTVNNSGEALGFFNKKVSETLHSIKDGMDMSLCFINMEKLELQYAGANNSIYIIRNKAVGELQMEKIKTEEKKRMFVNVPVAENANQVSPTQTFSNCLLEIKADKQAIGADSQEVKVFTNNVIKLEKGDVIYMFTDGYADQFGGEKGKKFKYGKFKELLLEIQSLTMKKQQEILNERFEEWRGNLEQVDDILIVGIKI
ncbi:MAG: two-component regulator propeller domain-containing protein [Bacteroidota bacterium]